MAALAYSGYTLAMMAVFGTEECGPAGLSASYFNMFSQLAPLEAREGRIGRRRWLSGAATWATVPGSLALVVGLDRHHELRRGAGGSASEPDRERL